MRKKLGFFLFFVLIISLPLLIFTLQKRQTIKQRAAVNTNYDVIVVGAGTGGVAAAIQAARTGVNVLLIEETDWLGGQMAAGVSVIDENFRLAERDSGFYKEWYERIVSYYSARGKSVGTCYFGSTTMCAEPKVAKDTLQQMINETQTQAVSQGRKLDTKFLTKVIGVSKSGNTVNGIYTRSQNGSIETFSSKVLIDATEYGDVIPLTGVQYRVGNSTSDNKNLAACIQDFTYGGVIRKYSTLPLPAEVQVPSSPPNPNPAIAGQSYNEVKPLFSSWLVGSKTIFTWGPTAPWDLVEHNAYRGMPDSQPGTPNYTAASYAAATAITKSGINLQPQDYAANVQFLEDPVYRQTEICKAKLRTLQYLYYINKELGNTNWTLADDQDYQNSSYTTNNLCPLSIIPAEYKNLEKYLPPLPYIRESRRIVGTYTLTAGDIYPYNDPGADAFANQLGSSIAMGGYNNDLHSCTGDANLETTLENDAQRSNIYRRFSVPLGTLIPSQIDGFMVAEKNISQTRLANGATRLQPITMQTGQAAGATAALAVKNQIRVREVLPHTVEEILAKAHAKIVTYPFTDVTPGDLNWAGIQFSAANQIMVGINGGRQFSQTAFLRRDEMAAVLVRIFNLPVDPNPALTFTDVNSGTTGLWREVYAIKTAGIASGYGDGTYRPANPTLRMELATFLSRALGLASTTPTIGSPYSDVNTSTTGVHYNNILLLYEKGIMFGCTSTTFCPSDNMLRGDMATVSMRSKIYKFPNPINTISYTLPFEPTLTPSLTPTITPLPTFTITPSPTSTPIPPTNTPTPTPTRTPTPTATNTPVPPTATPTQTPTPTNTPVPPTATPTRTPTPTVTNTPTPSLTVTPIPPTATPTIVIGDTNGDNVVNLSDLTNVLQKWLNSLTNAVDQISDGRINAMDFVRVLKQIP